MRKEKILAIDDYRELCFADILCRTYSTGIKALKLLGPWDKLYLDHDLGAINQEYDNRGHELTGLHILRFLEDNPKFMPKEIHIITGNAAARPKMEQLAKLLIEENK